ncbi:MAG: FAD-dependent oxidoreductase [Proteobacteria bacterium]|nr:FAD-dependent oxidoreductase [Pseudomonadota bacterium]MCH8176315.1 FAD-dependent oxidoreductase [Pseudomonadota bacterium]
MAEENCIIVGASHAGTTLALQLRKEGWSGKIQLISAERELPYHRPPLSKDLLSGAKTLDGIRLRPAQVFEDNDIALLLGTQVESIDTASYRVRLADGRELKYDKLALCTGAAVRKLPLGQSLENIFTIRFHADTAALARHIEVGKKAVVIGAGYIGLETAAVLAGKGLQLTVLEMAERVLQRVTSATMSAYMTQLHSQHGVNIVTSTTVVDIQGDSAVEKVVCADGQEFEADFLIVGIGVDPETSLAKAAGLDIDGGIVVDEFARSSCADVYAAGDCTVHPSLIYDRRIRLESVQNANDQGRVVAANICGKQIAYDAVPWFWSDQYDIKLQMVGLNAGYDEVVCRGDSSNPDGAGFALFYLKDSVLIAADCVSRPKEFVVAKQLVKNRVRLASSVLQDEAVEPVNFAP